MNKKIILLLIFLTVNCSFNSQSKFWTKETKIKVERTQILMRFLKKTKFLKKN